MLVSFPNPSSSGGGVWGVFSSSSFTGPYFSPTIAKATGSESQDPFFSGDGEGNDIEVAGLLLWRWHRGVGFFLMEKRCYIYILFAPYITLRKVLEWLLLFCTGQGVLGSNSGEWFLGFSYF